MIEAVNLNGLNGAEEKRFDAVHFSQLLVNLLTSPNGQQF
jgi:hypothetical protein